MSFMSTIKILMLIALFGHLLCGICDCLLIYTPSGKFGFQLMNDNDKMRETFRTMPLQNPMSSMLLGVLALRMSCGGYFALYLWMRQFSIAAAVIMLIAAAVFYIPGTAHHIFCGVAEWFYIRMGMTENAREAIADFFKKTSVTMVVCYMGLIVLSITLFVMVVTGSTTLPSWACIFNILLIASVLFPLRIGGAGNWAGAIMFLGLIFLI